MTYWTFSKIEAGKIELEYNPFFLHTCIEEAINVIARRASQKKLDVSFCIGPQRTRRNQGGQDPRPTNLGQLAWQRCQVYDPRPSDSRSDLP